MRILILLGGGEGPLEAFRKAGKRLGLQVSAASFSKLSYLSAQPLLINGRDIASFDVVYLRVVGKRQEDARLVVGYLKDKGVRVVDRSLPLAKSAETRLLAEAGIPIPQTYFASLEMIREEAPRIFGFPFVLKSTTGKQGHAVWSPRNREELIERISELSELEKRGERFIAQEFVEASQRNRVLVIGERAVAGITRPTRWRKRFAKEEGVRAALNPVPAEDARLAVRAAKALGIEVAGVDIIHEDRTGKPYVLEVNSAPRWAAIEQDTGINVEEEILRYLAPLST